MCLLYRNYFLRFFFNLIRCGGIFSPRSRVSGQGSGGAGHHGDADQGNRK
jgi:hypothetical protein